MLLKVENFAPRNLTVVVTVQRQRDSAGRERNEGQPGHAVAGPVERQVRSHLRHHAIAPQSVNTAPTVIRTMAGPFVPKLSCAHAMSHPHFPLNGDPSGELHLRKASTQNTPPIASQATPRSRAVNSVRQ